MKILVCDDDPVGRTIVSMVLKSLGHQMEVVNDGREALEKIQQKPDFFDLLITDNLMPRLSGIELVEKLRDMNLPMKVIMITGFPCQLNAEVQNRLQLGGVLIKPFKPAQLFACVNQLGCKQDVA